MPVEPAVSRPALFIQGHGVISSAGSGGESLYRACVENSAIPTHTLERSVGGEPISYDYRTIDADTLKAAQPKHPRLRRCSSVTKFAVTAACQAMGEERIGRIKKRELKIGIIVSFLNGCVNYSNRFFGEVLSDPTLASPILFPETVFNAPASHIAAFLECDGPVTTLVGDPTNWFTAFEIAEDWIASGLADGCLIVCGEETDWLTLEGIGLYSRGLIATEGAAAIYVNATPSDIAISRLHGPFPYSDGPGRRAAISEAWDGIKYSSGSLLIDGLTGASRIDKDEAAITRDWDGPRLSPSRILGEGMALRCGLQTIAAIEAIRHGHPSATILAAGGNQQAFSALFSRHHP